MHGMSMGINIHNVHDTNILLLNFYAFSDASRVTSLLFMKTAFYVIRWRGTTCKKLYCFKTLVYAAYIKKHILHL